MCESALPTSATEMPAPAVLVPMRRRIVPAGSLANPMPRNPDVVPSVPSPVPRHPDEVGAWRRNRLDHYGRWRYANVEIDIDARGNIRHSDREAYQKSGTE